MSTQAHTPTPWTYSALQKPSNFAMAQFQVSAGVVRIAKVVDERDAIFIVKACNAHAELAESLHAVVGRLESAPGSYRKDNAEVIGRTRAILAKVQNDQEPL